MKSILVILLGVLVMGSVVNLSYADEMAKPVSFRFMIGKKKIFDQYAVQQVSASKNEEANQWEVSLRLGSKGSKKLADATRKNIGKSMSVILDGKVISSPTIVAPIDGGHAAFTGNFSQAQAEEIVKRIKTAIPTE